MDEQQHKAGFVSIVGNPNVGKSTLLNVLTNERLSIVTAKAQTTRHRIMGVVSGEHFQIVYSDTPGVLIPAYKMQEYMMKYVSNVLKDSDILIYMVECGETKCNENILDYILHSRIPLILVINKIDLATAEKVLLSVQHWQSLLHPLRTCCISALEATNVSQIIENIIELLPFSPPYFPKDELTDRPTRFFVAEIIREQILLQFKKEVPYSVEIEITEYKEDKHITRIYATVFVERESQKAIILGHKGKCNKELSTKSREAIEEFISQKVFLSLTIKVQKNWRNDERHLRRFGYGV